MYLLTFIENLFANKHLIINNTERAHMPSNDLQQDSPSRIDVKDYTDLNSNFSQLD
jgi:hypothetical protein